MHVITRHILTHFHVCSGCPPWACSQNSAELTGRSDTKTMAKMRIIKGKFWSIMTSLQALTVVNYDTRAGITVRSGGMWKTCFCRATETRCASWRVVVFISERKNRIGSYLRQRFLWLVLEKTFIYLLMIVNAERSGVYMHFLF